MSPRLSPRALNRTLLARQLLLERRDYTVMDALRHLAGIQAQEPQAPYLAFWSRIAGFDPVELSDLISNRQAVRGSLMRCTVHLVAADDWQWLWPTCEPVLTRAFKGSPFSKQIAGVDLPELLAAGHDYLRTQPRSRAELSQLMAARWPDADPASLAHAASLLTPVVQVPPRGLWRTGGQARWAPSAIWLGAEVEEKAQVETLITRYLEAFGPATVQDVQAWSGLTKLTGVIGEMDLARYSDTDGRELFDVKGGHLEDAATPAPPRLLAPFDNVLLSHADRSRIIDRATRELLNRDRLMRAFLVDGFAAGTWRLDQQRLSILPARPLAQADVDQLRLEAEQLLGFVHPHAEHAEIVVHPPAGG